MTLTEEFDYLIERFEMASQYPSFRVMEPDLLKIVDILKRHRAECPADRKGRTYRKNRPAA